MRPTIGLSLQLLHVAMVGETLMGSLSREASTSSTLACQEVSSGGVGTSALWGKGMSASVVASFPIVECSDLQLVAN